MTAEMTIRDTEVVRWINHLWGPDTPYNAPRSLSLAAGLSQNTVGNVLNSGRADPETIIALADLTKTPRIEAFIKAGWLRGADVLPGVSEDEAMFLATKYRRLTADERKQLETNASGWLLLRGEAL